MCVFAKPAWCDCERQTKADQEKHILPDPRDRTRQHAILELVSRTGITVESEDAHANHWATEPLPPENFAFLFSLGWLPGAGVWPGFGLRAEGARPNVFRALLKGPNGPPPSNLPGMFCNPYEGLEGLFFLFLFRRHGNIYMTTYIYIIHKYTQQKECSKNLSDSRPIMVEISLYLQIRIWGALGLKLSDSYITNSRAVFTCMLVSINLWLGCNSVTS